MLESVDNFVTGRKMYFSCMQCLEQRGHQDYYTRGDVGPVYTDEDGKCASKETFKYVCPPLFIINYI